MLKKCFAAKKCLKSGFTNAYRQHFSSTKKFALWAQRPFEPPHYNTCLLPMSRYLRQSLPSGHAYSCLMYTASHPYLPNPASLHPPMPPYPSHPAARTTEQLARLAELIVNEAHASFFVHKCADGSQFVCSTACCSNTERECLTRCANRDCARHAEHVKRSR